MKDITEKATSIFNKSMTLVDQRTINKLNKFVKIQKDKTDPAFTDHIIYRINCKNCDAFYVGQTKKK